MIIETKLVQKPEFLAVGMRESVKLNPGEKPSENAISLLWDRFRKRCGEISHQVNFRSYGFIQQMHNWKPGDPILYIAAVGVNSLGELPEGMITMEVPESLYAVVTYRGHLDGIGEGFDFFWEKWLPEADYVYDGKYEFEFYDQRFRSRNDPSSEIDLYFPVKPKQ